MGSPPSDPYQQQSQTNRNEPQQNRPNSQGGYAAGAGPNPASAGNFAGGELAGQQVGGDGQNYLYGSQAGHNGASGDY